MPGIAGGIGGAVAVQQARLGGGFDDAGQIPDLSGDSGAAGRAIHGSGKREGDVAAWFDRLSRRLRRVRVVCGDWSRICTPAVTVGIGTTAVFLDPPYSAEAGRDANIYSEESLTVAHDVRRWCEEHGADPRLRIALCGYEGEHDALEAQG